MDIGTLITLSLVALVVLVGLSSLFLDPKVVDQEETEVAAKERGSRVKKLRSLWRS